MDPRYADIVKDLSDEVKALAVNCKTPEDIISLAEKENIVLSEEQLDAINGGGWGDPGDWGCFKDDSDDPSPC